MTGNRIWKRVAVGLGVLLVCGLVGVGLYTRSSYGRWSPFTPPDRFEFCGASYYLAGAPGERVTTSRAGARRADRATRWLPPARARLLPVLVRREEPRCSPAYLRSWRAMTTRWIWLVPS
ncbi:hypothetical protein [Actinoallomurus sp. NPDC052274]|uniref:hypothetical protein n=1 Tax=Actinoallomurus sp. NPDC052274 TaxID=3155420 RepID=UPI003444DC98